VTSGTGQAWVKQQEYSPLQKCLMAPVNGPQDFAALNERCAVEEQVRQQEQQLKDAQASAAAHAEALRRQDLAALQRGKEIAQEKLRQDAAQARHEEIIKAYKSQVTKAEADQAQRGYKAMTLDDFLLDSQKLVAAGAKVAVAGSYKKLGQSTVLFPNAMAADSSDMRLIAVLVAALALQRHTAH
jgi:hypothetical protein